MYTFSYFFVIRLHASQHITTYTHTHNFESSHTSRLVEPGWNFSSSSVAVVLTLMFIPCVDCVLCVVCVLVSTLCLLSTLSFKIPSFLRKKMYFVPQIFHTYNPSSLILLTFNDYILNTIHLQLFNTVIISHIIFYSLLFPH